ncbi:hypothetical protein J7F01_19920 [Streptomyces sp. ISL-22]|uniref:hypothetical protein n=1 Tax=unclassified Streptomyces TaxID=2593676 RepID=UPI001BEB9B35|nr:MULTISPECIES: hypothetical protein [unclassified Streptomyces]MBT2418496.1 hypothetical protein [Streptomyces sp. ISL-24]MBT2434401.1 hypothetical protein [Streptomyces sp. ISL-22]
MMWDEKGLSGLQAQLAHEMLSRVTAFSLGREVRLVRGVVTSPDRRGVGRVVLWDGQQLDSSVAFDVPLTDRHGGNIPSGDLAAALRGALADCSGREVEEAPRDVFGIPVIDASAAVHAFVAQPRFQVADALHAAAAAFSVPPEPDEPAELRLCGFLLLDQATCRLYLDTPASEGAPPFGVDLPLRDEEDTVVAGVTAVHAALPVLLLLGELERMRKNVHDPYCRAVYDLVDWLSGR